MPIDSRCPKCGFAYAWDGVACRHCCPLAGSPIQHAAEPDFPKFVKWASKSKLCVAFATVAPILYSILAQSLFFQIQRASADAAFALAIAVFPLAILCGAVLVHAIIGTWPKEEQGRSASVIAVVLLMLVEACGGFWMYISVAAADSV